MAYTPPVGSPLALGTHPRLHVTDWSAVHAKADSDATFQANFGTLVSYVDSKYSGAGLVVTSGVVSESYAHYFAFVGRVLAVGSVTGVTPAHTSSEYLAKAISALNTHAALNYSTCYPGTGEGYWYNVGTYTPLCLGYDWCYSLLSSSERTAIVGHMMDAASMFHAAPWTLFQDGADKVSLWSSKKNEATYPWLGGLACYGDGIRDATAQTMLDSFETYALNGGIIDAANWVAGDNGGCNDPGDYASTDYMKTFALVDAWRTASTQNYFSTATPYPACHVRYWPQYYTYILQPWDDGHIIRMGQMELWGGPEHLGSAWRGQNRNILSFLSYVDTDMQALQEWLLEQNSYQGGTYTSSYPQLLLYDILFNVHGVTAKTPAQVGLTRSKFFEGLGLTVVRDGFTTGTDALFAGGGPPYYYVTGHAFDLSGIPGQEIEPIGFTLHKHGPLLFEYYSRMRYTSTTWWHHRRNMTRVTDPAYNGLWGGYRNALKSPTGLPSDTSQNNVLEVINEPYDRWAFCEHVANRTYANDPLKINSILIDQTNAYMPERVSFNKRHYVFLGVGDATKSDYLVIKERVNTASASLRTRFELCSVAAPTFDGTSAGITSWNGYTSDAASHIQTTDSSVATFSNYATADPLRPTFNPYASGCNGKAVVTYLLPASKKLTKVGGTSASYFLSDNGNQYSGDLTNAAPYGTTYSGGCYTDCEPATQTTTTDFLVVIQACRNDVTASTVSSVTINTGNMHGAYIADADEGKVVLFTTRGNTTATVSTEVESAVNYTISHTGAVRHVLNDMDSSLMFDVAQGGTPIVTAQTPVNGVLTFTSTNGGTFAVTTGAPVTPKYFVFRK